MATINQQTVIPSQHATALVSSLSKIAEGFSFFKKKATNAALRGNTAATNLLGSITQNIPQLKSVLPQVKTTSQNTNQSTQIQPNPTNNQSNDASHSTIKGSIKQTIKEHISGGIKGLKQKFGTKEGLLNVAAGAAGGGIMSAILKESADKIADSKTGNARKEKFISRYLSKTEKGQELSKNLSKDDARAEALKVYEKEAELLKQINELENEHKKLKAEGLEITEEELEHIKDLEKQKSDLISGKKQNSNPAPVQQTPVQQTPVQQTPVQQTPVQQTPVQQTPVQQTPVQQTPVQSTPVQSTASNKSIAALNKQSRKTQKALNRAAVLQKSATNIIPTPNAKDESQNSDVGTNNSSILKKIYSSILISNKELKKMSNYSKIKLMPASKKPGFLNSVTNVANSAKEKGGSLLSTVMNSGSRVADAATEAGGSLLSSAGSGIARIASSAALPALGIAAAGAAGYGVGTMISNALPNLGSDIYDFVHGEPEKEKPFVLDKKKIAEVQQKKAESARAEFAKTDPRIIKPEVAEAASARAEFAKTDPRIIKPEVTARESQTTQLEQNTSEVEQAKQKNATPIINAPSSSPTTIINNNSTVTANRPDIRLQEPTYTQIMGSTFRRNPFMTI